MLLRNRKRFLALIAAAAMVFSPCAAFADSSSGNASSNLGLEGWVDQEIFNVTLPTVSNNLDLILDPQGLIESTKTDSNSIYNTKTITETNQTAYFLSAANTYTHYSETLEIVDESTIPVSISVEATISGSAVSFCTDSAFTTDEDAQVYLAIVTEAAVANTVKAGTPIDPDTGNATVSCTMSALDYDTYYDSTVSGTAVDGKNEYEAKRNTTATPADHKYSFHLEAAANPNADWGSLETVDTSVELVWTVDAMNSETEVYGAVKNAAVLIGSDDIQPTPSTFPAGTTFSDVVIAGHPATNDDFSSVTVGDGCYLRITAERAKAVAGSDWGFPLEVTFKANGQNYKCNIQQP